jgi:hypothetical protein
MKFPSHFGSSTAKKQRHSLVFPTLQLSPPLRMPLVARKLLHGAILTRVVPFWRNCTKQLETKSLPQLDGVPFNGCRNQRKD